MFKHFDRCHGQVLHRPLVTGIIDTTECPVQRSMNANTQRTFYSGKKKQHTVKYELVWDLATELFSWVNGPFPGSVHDLTIARQGVLNYLSIREILLGDLAY
ncbi:DDE Tnp4 domain-containing protein [Balamuthia mandrillaris]